MANQKLETLLNLALEMEEAQRQKSGQLGVGFLEETGTWELIVKYNGDLGRLRSNVDSRGGTNCRVCNCDHTGGAD